MNFPIFLVEPIVVMAIGTRIRPNKVVFYKNKKGGTRLDRGFSFTLSLLIYTWLFVIGDMFALTVGLFILLFLKYKEKKELLVGYAMAGIVVVSIWLFIYISLFFLFKIPPTGSVLSLLYQFSVVVVLLILSVRYYKETKQTKGVLNK